MEITGMNDIVSQETGPRCPVCGGKVIQRKSTVTCVTRYSSPDYELEWQCAQCEMNFSAETAGRAVLSKRVAYESPREKGIDILGNAAVRRGVAYEMECMRRYGSNDKL